MKANLNYIFMCKKYATPFRYNFFVGFPPDTILWTATHFLSIFFRCQKTHLIKFNSCTNCIFTFLLSCLVFASENNVSMSLYLFSRNLLAILQKRKLLLAPPEVVFHKVVQQHIRALHLSIIPTIPHIPIVISFNINRHTREGQVWQWTNLGKMLQVGAVEVRKVKVVVGRHHHHRLQRDPNGTSLLVCKFLI